MKILKNELAEYVKESNRNKRKPLIAFRENAVRPCVIEKGLENCSQCDNYVCKKLAPRIVEYEGIKNRIKKGIPEEEYICFIRPYENKRRL